MEEGVREEEGAGRRKKGRGDEGKIGNFKLILWIRPICVSKYNYIIYSAPKASWATVTDCQTPTGQISGDEPDGWIIGYEAKV